MLNDFTGGGQIFLHKLRMFFQILERSFKTAFLISIIIVGVFSYKQLDTLDLKAAMTYQKAIVANYMDNATGILREAYRPNSGDYYTKINAYDKVGLHTKDADPRKVLKSKWFKKPYFEVIDFIKVKLMITASVMLGIFLLIYLTWSKFGKSAKEKKHLSGHIVKTAREVAQTLKKKGIASHFHLNGLLLVKDSETKHILVTGSTGSGKTNCLHTLLPQIRARKQPAIVVDTEGEMIARYYRPGYDIILNPFDSRSCNWNLWEEIDSNRTLKKVASSFFPGSPPDAHNSDGKWDDWGKMLFVGALEYLRNKSNPTIEELYNLVHKEPIEELIEKLKTTSVGTLLASSGNNTASHSIRINTLLATEWLEFISDSPQKAFSFKKWFASLDDSKEDK